MEFEVLAFLVGLVGFPLLSLSPLNSSFCVREGGSCPALSLARLARGLDGCVLVHSPDLREAPSFELVIGASLF